MTANGAGGVAESAVAGQARNLGNRLSTQTISPITYLVSPDATGILNFPTVAGQTETSQLILGAKNIFVSADGNYFIGGSLTAGSHGLVVGVKSCVKRRDQCELERLLLQRRASLRCRSISVFVECSVCERHGGWRCVWTSHAAVRWTLRCVHRRDVHARKRRVWTVHFDSGARQCQRELYSFSTSGVDVTDSLSYELSFGVRMPTQSGAGVFVDPQRVLNGASFALGYPVSPGGFVTLFGTGLSPQTTNAKTFPFPLTLGNVSATVNGKGAPIYLVSPTQISLVVPYSTTGSTATIVVNLEQCCIEFGGSTVGGDCAGDFQPDAERPRRWSGIARELFRGECG